MRLVARLLKGFCALPEGRVMVWADRTPPKLLNTPQLIRRISLGQSHGAAVSVSGKLYTFGSNKHGQLGLGHTKDIHHPTLVDYFESRQLTIKDAVCGDKHTIVLTQDGNVYTFGWGGRNLGFIMRIFLNSVGPLGHGSTKSSSTPIHLAQLKDIQRISAGRLFNMTFNRNGEVYNWGNGEYAVFGDGNNKNYNKPVKNDYFRYLYEDENLRMLKVKSAQSFSVALMSNGKLYGWGSNESGQMGIKSEIGIEAFETVNFVTQIIREGYQNQKVINFDISQNTLLFLLDNGQLWWSGMKIAYKPQRAPLSVDTYLFAAGSKSYVVIDKNNRLYSKNQFVPGLKNVDLKTGIESGDARDIFHGKVVGIGGQYGRRYAIVTDD